MRPGDPELERARDAAAALVRWSHARNDEDASGTRAALDEATRLEPGWVEPWLWLATFHVDMNDLGSALRAANQGFQHCGRSLELLRVRAHVKLTMRDAEGALPDCEAIVEQWPSAPAFTARAEARALRGDRVGAVEDLTRALELEPAVVQRWRRRGELRVELGDPGHLDDFLEATRRAPEDPLAWIGLAKVHGSAGRTDEALEAMDRAIEVAPTLAQAWWVRATVHAMRGDEVAALRDVDEALRLAPDDPRFLADRAGYTILSDPAAAERALDRVLATVPDVVPGALVRRAEARRQQKELAAAVDDTTAAIALKPSTPEPWLVRGKARFELGRREEAIADLERFLRLAPADHPEARGARLALERLRAR